MRSVISPDLSREKTEVPDNIGVYRNADLEKMARRGVIYTVAPSFQDLNTIWVGTDDGLIHSTHDGGKTWKNITPPELTAWSKVSLMEASHYDDETAYDLYELAVTYRTADELLWDAMNIVFANARGGSAVSPLSSSQDPA